MFKLTSPFYCIATRPAVTVATAHRGAHRHHPPLPTPHTSLNSTPCYMSSSSPTVSCDTILGPATNNVINGYKKSTVYHDSLTPVHKVTSQMCINESTANRTQFSFLPMKYTSGGLPASLRRSCSSAVGSMQRLPNEDVGAAHARASRREWGTLCRSHAMHVLSGVASLPIVRTFSVSAVSVTCR